MVCVSFVSSFLVGAFSQAYRELFSESLPESVLEEIRYDNKKCLPLGGAQFKAQVEAKLRIKLGTGKVGRPKDAT
jgi:hypothetical protein